MAMLVHSGCHQHKGKQHDMTFNKGWTTSTNERNRSAFLDLKTKAINTKEKNKKELVQLCVLHEIPSVITVENFREGWEGRVKGLLQVHWERGFIDSTYLNKYDILAYWEERTQNFQQCQQLETHNGNVCLLFK